MTSFIHERLEATLFPSRRRIAIFRLAACLRLFLSVPRRQEEAVFAIEPDQSSGESLAASVIVFVTVTSYLFLLATPSSATGRLLAAAGCLVVAPPLLLVPMVVTDALLRLARSLGVPVSTDHLAQQWLAIVSILTVVSIPVAMSGRWERWIAAAFLGGVIVNVVSFLILLPMRGFIARLERERGGEPFVL